MSILRLSLKKKWFDMTKSGIRTEDYRDITPYWIKRLMSCDLEEFNIKDANSAICALADGYTKESVLNIYGYRFKSFKLNAMTLGYPKSTDTERIIKLKHKCIEIGTGNPEWGAEPNKLYFVIKHGEPITE